MKKTLPIIITLLKFPLWLILTGLMAHSIATLQMEHYQPDDMPNERFSIAVVDDYPRNLQEFNGGDFTPQTTPSSEYTEDYLRINDDGTFTFHNEGALWNSQSTYRIENGTVIPISYRFFSVGHAFYGMIGASLAILLGNYVVRRFLYRHNKGKLQAYHQQVLHDIKLIVIAVGVALLAYGALLFF